MAGMTGITNSAASSISSAYSKNTSKAGNAMKSISSGTRLVDAKTDASSLAISEKLRTKIGVLNQAARNVSEAQSMIENAVGGLRNIQNLLTDMKALAAKGTNATMDTDAFAAVAKDYAKMVDAVQKILDTTRAGTTKLLADTGGFSGDFQIAENSADKVTVAIPEIDTTTFLGITSAPATPLALTDASEAAALDTALNGALTKIQGEIATLGAQQKEFDYLSDNLGTAIANAVDQKAVYADADIAKEMTELTQANVSAQLSTAMLSKSLELQQGLVSMAR